MGVVGLGGNSRSLTFSLSATTILPLSFPFLPALSPHRPLGYQILMRPDGLVSSCTVWQLMIYIILSQANGLMRVQNNLSDVHARSVSLIVPHTNI
ncbi:hypothetical protein C8Q78DRAFT_1151919 [Trametes maxima]|nr:hypothetical protein C8Q78DRAFT_1151919 [Trametes maxima]